jgi:hypothetical protein
MMVGNKKTSDVQFYVEAGLPPEDLSKQKINIILNII